MSINEALLQGNVGQEPEIRSTQSGKEIANFSLATTEKWTDKSTGEVKEKTEWHRIVIFNENLVKLVKNYVHKGSKLILRGAIQTRKWTDKDGAEKYTTEIVLNGFQSMIKLLDSKKETSSKPQESTQTASGGVDEDYVPF